MIHLSARLAWHDNGWDGCVCRAPHLNSSCIVQDNIRDARVDDEERKCAGVCLANLKGWHPPCSRDINAHGAHGYALTHHDPLKRSFPKPVTEEILLYTFLPAAYCWLREENLRDTCEAEGPSIRGPENPEKEDGWIYKPGRQRAFHVNKDP